MQSNINYYKWMVICLVMIVFGIGVGFIGFPKFLHNMIKGVRDSTVLQRRNACNAFEIETISEVKTAISDAFDCAKISFRCGFRDKITERFCLRFEGRSKWHRVLKQNLNEPGVSRKKKKYYTCWSADQIQDEYSNLKQIFPWDLPVEKIVVILNCLCVRFFNN